MIKRILNKSGTQLFILAFPSLFLIFIFSYVPLVGMVIPFKDMSATTDIFKSSWAGFANFKFLFQTTDSLIAARNTVLYNFTFITAGTLFSLLLALIFNEFTSRSIKVYQTLAFIPYFISWVVAGYVFNGLLDMDNGLMNQLLKLFGSEPVSWYLNKSYWPIILIFSYLWKNVGYYTIIYYTGLMGIDSGYYEAAALDGANRFQQITKITIPLLSPLIIIMVVLQIGRIFFGDFGLFYYIPKNSAMLYPTTDVIDTFVYRALKNLSDIGMSSAAGFIQSVCGLVLVIATNTVIRRIDAERAIF